MTFNRKYLRDPRMLLTVSPVSRRRMVTPMEVGPAEANRGFGHDVRNR
jgi:hypothetical protein